MIKRIFCPVIAVAALIIAVSLAFGQGGPMGQRQMGPGQGMMGPGQMMPGMGQMGQGMMGMQHMMPGMGGEGYGPMGMMGMGGRGLSMRGPWMMGRYMASALGLSSEQYAKIAPLGKEFYRERVRKTADIRLAKADLIDLETAKDFSLAKIEAKIKEIVAIESDLMLARAKYIGQVREQLTEEQREKLNSMLPFMHRGF